MGCQKSLRGVFGVFDGHSACSAGHEQARSQQLQLRLRCATLRAHAPTRTRAATAARSLTRTQPANLAARTVCASGCWWVSAFCVPTSLTLAETEKGPHNSRKHYLRVRSYNKSLLTLANRGCARAAAAVCVSRCLWHHVCCNCRSAVWERVQRLAHCCSAPGSRSRLHSVCSPWYVRVPSCAAVTVVVLTCAVRVWRRLQGWHSVFMWKARGTWVAWAPGHTTS